MMFFASRGLWCIVLLVVYAGFWQIPVPILSPCPGYVCAFAPALAQDAVDAAASVHAEVGASFQGRSSPGSFREALEA